MKTLVTGGTGFIGSHLVKGLLQRGREVIVASDLSRLGIDNLSGLGIKSDDVELREADLSDYQQALRAVKGADSVFHLAARIGNLQYLHGSQMAEYSALQTNLLLDANIFKACLENKVKKIVYASSCAVYPIDRQLSYDCVLSEDDLFLDDMQAFNTKQRIVNPDGGYGWAKFIGEMQLVLLKGIDISIARIFNAYGENEPLGEKAHAVGDIIRKAIFYPQKEFIVYGDGKQSRDFLYVSDCADALMCIEAKAANPPLIVNIGSGQAVSLGTIAEKVAALSQKDINIKYDLKKPVGPLSRTADMSRARATLDWQPEVSLDEGLKRTYKWIKKRIITDFPVIPHIKQ